MRQIKRDLEVAGMWVVVGLVVYGVGGTVQGGASTATLGTAPGLESAGALLELAGLLLASFSYLEVWTALRTYRAARAARRPVPRQG